MSPISQGPGGMLRILTFILHDGSQWRAVKPSELQLQKDPLKKKKTPVGKDVEKLVPLQVVGENVK